MDPKGTWTPNSCVQNKCYCLFNYQPIVAAEAVGIEPTMHFWRTNCFQDSLLIRPDYFRFFESSTAIEPINRRFAICALSIWATWLSKKSSFLSSSPVSFGFSFISFSNLVYLPKLHQSKVFFWQDDKQRAVVSNHTRFTTSCLFSKQQRAPAHFTHYFCVHTAGFEPATFCL